MSNKAIIFEINLRSFNAKDIDEDGFIDETKGESRGTFINAVDRLDEVKNLGINTLHLLPITQTGKFKALGTAGSLYSVSKFNKLNNDLYDKNSKLSLEDQAKYFIKEAHKRNIRIIVDVPACGSYDLYLERPDLFVKTSTEDAVIPADWSDVRLLNSGTEDNINTEVLNLYNDYVKYMISLGIDGIRVDVAHSKPAKFWELLINSSRNKDPQMMWLAEASDSWNEPISKFAVFTNYKDLLNAGFDGYYGSFFNIKNWNNASEMNKQIQTTLNDLKNYKEKKSVIGSFTTHDEVSPIVLKGEKLSEMIIWLNSTLPVNSYYVDGFQTGDDYSYPNGNKLAPNSNTDDDTYFIHNGQLDIFNFSRKPGGNNIELKNNLIIGNDIKNSINDILNNGTYKILKTNHSKIFAYTFFKGNKYIVTVGSLDFKKELKATVKLPFKTEKYKLYPIKISKMPITKGKKLNLTLNAGETYV